MLPSRRFLRAFCPRTEINNMEAAANTSKFRWRENTLAERRRMRNDRRKRKRLQRRKAREHEATKAVSDRLHKETLQKDRFLYLARKYYLKWQQIKEAHKKLHAKASSTLQLGSRFGTNTRVSSVLLKRIAHTKLKVRFLGLGVTRVVQY